jgi:hypothetical protein
LDPFEIMGDGVLGRLEPDADLPLKDPPELNLDQNLLSPEEEGVGGTTFGKAGGNGLCGNCGVLCALDTDGDPDSSLLLLCSSLFLSRALGLLQPRSFE